MQWLPGVAEKAANLSPKSEFSWRYLLFWYLAIQQTSPSSQINCKKLLYLYLESLVVLCVVNRNCVLEKPHPTQGESLVFGVSLIWVLL